VSLPGGAAFGVDSFGDQATVAFFVGDVEMHQVHREALNDAPQGVECFEVTNAVDDARCGRFLDACVGEGSATEVVPAQLVDQFGSELLKGLAIAGPAGKLCLVADVVAKGCRGPAELFGEGMGDRALARLCAPAERND